MAFRQIHTADGGRVRTRKVCEIDGQQIPDEEVGRGYETAVGTLIPVTDEDLDRLPLPTAKTIDIVAFVPAASIDPMAIGASYYVAASGPASAKPYVLLRMALNRSTKVAVAKIAWHGRERLALLRVLGEALVMHMMRWPDEIRSTAGVSAPPADAEPPEEEVQAAVELTDVLSGLAMEDLHDEYREALEAVIHAKAEGRGLEPPQPAEAPPGQVVDLMAALEKSVQDAKRARGESEEATVHEMPDATKKTASGRKSTRKPRSA